MSERIDEKLAGSQARRILSPEEILVAILAADLDDDVERVAALSDEEVERELVEAGVDLEQVRADSREIDERMMQLACGSAFPR
jgi:hypothetical protein